MKTHILIVSFLMLGSVCVSGQTPDKSKSEPQTKSEAFQAKTDTPLLAVASSIIAQDKPLPEYGDISDLKGMSAVYVNADSTQARKYILAELKKYPTLKVVDSPDNAEFFLDCARNGHILTSSTLIAEMDTYEMTVYTVKNGRHRIAWSRTKTSVRYAPTLLTGDFIGALKKSLKSKTSPAGGP